MGKLGSKMTPTCHPDRPYLARGMCVKCYQAKYRDPNGVKVHRERYVFTGPQSSPIPELAPVTQNAVTSFPISQCRKCASTLIQYVGREARCRCGYSVWLVREPISQPTGGQPARPGRAALRT